MKLDPGGLALSAPLIDLFSEPNYTQINSWVTEIANIKHDKQSRIDFVTFLGILGNAIGKVFDESIFGVFESVTRKRFSNNRFQGLFRVLRGASQTFIHVLQYEVPDAFSDADVFIINPKAGMALNMSPLFLWNLNARSTASDEPDLYAFDSVKGDDFSFKAVQFRAERLVTQTGDMGEIWAVLRGMRNQDPMLAAATGLSFVSTEIE